MNELRFTFVICILCFVTDAVAQTPGKGSKREPTYDQLVAMSEMLGESVESVRTKLKTNPQLLEPGLKAAYRATSSQLEALHPYRSRMKWSGPDRNALMFPVYAFTF